jgi:chorismate dehydratase
MTLRIGQIDYANCTPLFTALKKYFNCGEYKFVTGVPAQLNRMLSLNEIEICPSSSFEYGKSPDRYHLLPDLSISSVGEVKSVLLFSNYPIEELDGHTIGLTTESDTSVNLLKIVLKKFYGFTNDFRRADLSSDGTMKSFSAFLLIGDAALKAARDRKNFHIYDLGSLWYRFTGLPFVFALWIVTNEAVKTKNMEINTLGKQLLVAKRLAYDSYPEIAEGAKETEWISREELVDYWRTISYDLTERHLAGVRLFFEMATELGLLLSVPEIRMLD